MPVMPKVPKIISLHNLCNISRKNWRIKLKRMKLTFGANKHQSLVQVNTIIFGGRYQACRKYSKWLCSIFGIYQGWIEWWKWFFGCWQTSLLVLYFDGFCRACLKYPDKFAISLRYLKKEVRKILIFWYVRRPPNHVNQSLLQMIHFILKMKLETWGLVIMFYCSVFYFLNLKIFLHLLNFVELEDFVCTFQAFRLCLVGSVDFSNFLIFVNFGKYRENLWCETRKFLHSRKFMKQKYSESWNLYLWKCIKHKFLFIYLFIFIFLFYFRPLASTL